MDAVQRTCIDHKGVIDRLDTGNAILTALQAGQQEIMEALRGNDLTRSGGIVHHLEDHDARIEDLETLNVKEKILNFENRISALERILGGINRMLSMAGRVCLTLLLPAIALLVLVAKFIYMVWRHVS